MQAGNEPTAVYMWLQVCRGCAESLSYNTLVSSAGIVERHAQHKPASTRAYGCLEGMDVRVLDQLHRLLGVGGAHLPG